MSQTPDESGPPLHPSNPGVTVSGEVAFSNSERAWSESIHLVDLAAEVLTEKGFTVVKHGEDWLEHPASGFQISPRFVNLQPLNGGAVRTATTIQVNHPVLVPEGLFEYQHSTGKDVADSIRKGFEQWSQVDFVTLLDAALVQPSTCMTLVMGFPEKDGQPARHRRAVLGPVAHYRMAKPPDVGDNEEHPFCPCCLLTRCFEGFKAQFEDNAFLGVRLFAARDTEGVPTADCRINGNDHEPGAKALRRYVETWPEAGFEFRKQYVVLQDIDKPPDPEPAE